MVPRLFVLAPAVLIKGEAHIGTVHCIGMKEESAMRHASVPCHMVHASYFLSSPGLC
jgi:hypothetical protein